MKKLYPDLTEEERKAAIETLEQYLLLAWEMWEDSNGIEPE
jgi:hypothetical protein